VRLWILSLIMENVAAVAADFLSVYIWFVALCRGVKIVKIQKKNEVTQNKEIRVLFPWHPLMTRLIALPQ
jgi:hypothetical protein